jgi:BirA family biotin operon repressor/biotin-[acetyl-CoA-carboxylase] ligase
LSVLSRPGLPPAQAPLYTLAAAVATTRAVRAAGVGAGIKWPNDVLVHNPEAGSRERKIAGILTEMRGEADRIAWLVVGIGCNANVDPEALPAGATSLREGVGDVSRRELVQRLLREFEALRADPDSILPAWREHALTLGRRVRVETARGESVGRALDITFPGGLVLETADGRVTVSAGDCEHLRPVSR